MEQVRLDQAGVPVVAHNPGFAEEEWEVLQVQAQAAFVNARSVGPR